MSTDTITISKEEYKKLKQEARSYRRIASRVFETAIQDDSASVVADFEKTGSYMKAFLSDLADGLKKSSYSKSV